MESSFNIDEEDIECDDVDFIQQDNQISSVNQNSFESTFAASHISTSAYAQSQTSSTLTKLTR